MFCVKMVIKQFYICHKNVSIRFYFMTHANTNHEEFGNSQTTQHDKAHHHDLLSLQTDTCAY